MWQESAACRGADPFQFDVRELHTGREEAVIDATGLRYCASCPVVAQCGAMADESRHQGLFAGVYRRHQQGRYVWRVVVEGAPEPQLTDRRSGVRVGWVA